MHSARSHWKQNRPPRLVLEGFCVQRANRARIFTGAATANRFKESKKVEKCKGGNKPTSLNKKQEGVAR